MRRIVVVIVVALAVAPSAGAAAKARFSVTLRGSVLADWVEQTDVVIDGCTFAFGSTGMTRIAFRTQVPRKMSATRRGGLVRYGASRLRPLLAYSDWLSTPLPTVSEECQRTLYRDGLGGRGMFFAAAGISLTRPGPGLLVVGPWPGGAETLWTPEVFGHAAPPVDRAVGQIAERRLFDSRAKKIVVNARYDGGARLGGDYTGRLVEHVEWTLTLRRLAR